PLERPSELGHCTVAHRHRAVTARPPHAQLHTTYLLLGDLDRIEAARSHFECKAAELADRVLDALEQLGVLVCHEPRPVIAEALFVGERAEDHVARKAEA